MPDSSSARRLWCRYAALPSGLAAGVEISVEYGVITRIDIGIESTDAADRLEGLTLPGFANAHSHAFHRALRSRTHRGAGNFWTWREQMYSVAARLTPENYLALARATFAEMVQAAIDSGEIRSDVQPTTEAAFVLAGARGIMFQCLLVPRQVDHSHLQSSLLFALRGRWMA